MGGERNLEQHQQVKAILARTEDYLSLQVRRERRLTVQALLERGAETVSPEDWAKLRFEQGLIDAYESNYREAIAVWDAKALLDAHQREASDAGRRVHNTLSAYEAAIATYEHSSPGDPADGVVLGLLNRYPEAIAAFNQVLSAHPDDGRTWYNKAVTLGKLGREQAAISALDAALDLNPGGVKAHYGKAMLLCNLGRHGKAAAAWDSLLSLQPSRIEALFAQGLSLTYLGQYREAIAAIGAVLDLDPEDQEVLQDQGYAFRRLRRYQDAVEAYANALDFRQDYRGTNHRETSYPSFVRQQLVRLRAAIALDINQSNTSQSNTSQIEASNAADAPDAANAAAAASDANPFEPAGLETALPDKPELPLLVEQPKPGSQQPNDLERQAEPEEAAIAKPVEDVEDIAQAISRVDDSEPDEAAAESEAASTGADDASTGNEPSLPKGDYETRYNQGNALARQGRYEEAIAAYDAALAMQPDYRFAVYNKACCYALWGKVERALEQLEEAIALHPQYREQAKTDEDFASVWDSDRLAKT